MAATHSTLHDDLTAEERATLYVIAVYSRARGGTARFAAAQPCVVARVRRLVERACAVLYYAGFIPLLAARILL